jgi:hypothetical protein
MMRGLQRSKKFFHARSCQKWQKKNFAFEEFVSDPKETSSFLKM